MGLRTCKIFIILGTVLGGTAFTLSLGQDLRNIAATSEGGHLFFFSSQYNDEDWKALHLIDGSAQNGWTGQSNGAQSAIIGFKDNRLAIIEDVLIDAYTRENPSNWAKDVEIQISTTYPFRDFRTVGTFTLNNSGGDQVFSFPEPTLARFVKIRFLSNYGGGYMEAGEIQIMGRLLPDENPAPGFKSVGDEDAGARVEKFTSQYNDSDWAAANLIKPDGIRPVGRNFQRGSGSHHCSSRRHADYRYFHQ